jgi:hypothetical protein
MALYTPQMFAPRRVAVRRKVLTRYLAFDGSRYFLRVVLFLCLMSLLTLAQTGILATRGYTVAELETRQTTLLRERDLLHARYAEMQSLERVRSRAEALGLRPMRREQVQYITIPNGAQDIEGGSLADNADTDTNERERTGGIVSRTPVSADMRTVFAR